ncbi:F0F1-type ATP synthase assembly protein I [Marmoricola sp. URHA0025 HA25]
MEQDESAPRARPGWWPAVGAACVLVGATAVSMARRPDEFHAHYVWVEESVIVSRWLHDGWTSVLHPIQGDFLPFTAGFIGLASRLDWLAFPTADYVLAVVTFAATCALLLFPGSRWGGLPVRSAMVAYLAVVPVDPETYDVALYTFWWTSLWPLIVLGWTKRPGRLGFAVLVFAGLNSMAAAALFVVYLLTGLRERSRSLLAGAGVLGACFVLHAALYLRSDRHASSHTDVVKTLEQTFVNASWFVVRPLIGDRSLDHLLETGIGVVVVAVMVLCALRLGTLEARVVGLEILVVSGVYSALSALPAPFIAHPILAGGRYFFLPFAAWGMFLVYLVSRARREAVVATVGSFMLAWALARVPDAFVRHSERLDWHDEVVKCADSSRARYPLPIQFNGLRVNAWPMWVSPDVCRSALGR